jgi:hypothetical protein
MEKRRRVLPETATVTARALTMAVALMENASIKLVFATPDTAEASVALQMTAPESLLRATVAWATVHHLDYSRMLRRVRLRASWATQCLRGLFILLATPVN